MYNDNVSSSVPCHLKEVQQQYAYMQLARINFAEVTGHHHTWADNGGVDKGFLVYSLLLQLAVQGYEGVCLSVVQHIIVHPRM